MVIRMSVADVKAHLARVLHDVEKDGGKVIVERRGRPVAVLQAWTPKDEEPQVHWSEALSGVADDLPGFEEIMTQVVASRSRARTRRVDGLDD